MKNNKLTLVSGKAFQMSEGWNLGIDVLLTGNRISYIPANFTALMPDFLYFLDLSNNEIASIHPQAGLDAFDEIDLSNNRLTCLPDGFISSAYCYDLSGNELSTLQPDVLLPASYYNPRVFLTSNPVQCKTICWLKQSELNHDVYPEVDCLDRVNWDIWDGLDADGQCVIPLFPGCPLPSPIPTPLSQCPSNCQGRKDVFIK